MKVLITGASGFIGEHLLKRFLDKNIKINVLIRNKKKFKKNDRIAIYQGDLNNKSALMLATKGVDTVFHLAAILGGHDVSAKTIFGVNVDGTKNVLLAASENKVKKFIYLSAGAAMGLSDKIENETKICNPKSPYGKSKLIAEKVVRKICSKNNLPYVILRSTMVYGPGEVKNKLKMVKTIKKGYFRIIGNGENKISWVYIDNLIDGIMIASTKKNALGNTYIISDDRPYSMNEVVEIIAQETNSKAPSHIPKWIAYLLAIFFETLSKIFKFNPPLFVERIKSLTSNHMLSSKKAQQELGYSPKIEIKEGMKNTIYFYKKAGLLD